MEVKAVCNEMFLGLSSRIPVAGATTRFELSGIVIRACKRESRGRRPLWRPCGRPPVRRRSGRARRGTSDRRRAQRLAPMRDPLLERAFAPVGQFLEIDLF